MYFKIIKRNHIIFFFIILILIILFFNIYVKESFDTIKNKNHEIKCITVSTNYYDYLDFLVPKNINYFTKWYIVTDKNDIKTINVINKYNKIYNNKIVILFFDFKKNNKIFNKGGAIRYAQNYIFEKDYNPNDLILIMDSDIILNKNINEYIKNLKIKKNTVYCPSTRLLYKTIYDLKIKKNMGYDYFNKNNKKCIGYFQLYKQNKKFLYEDSHDSSICDDVFNSKFKKKIIINDSVIHLGKNGGENWKGRKINN